MGKWNLKCGFCSATPADLPFRVRSELVRMQEHAIAEHGVTLEEIMGAKRVLPYPRSYQWQLPDGSIYLIASEVIE